MHQGENTSLVIETRYKTKQKFQTRDPNEDSNQIQRRL